MHKFQQRIYLEDTDRFGMVYHANYLKLFERGRTEWLRSQGSGLEALYQAGYKMVVSNITLDFIKPARLDDEVFITTELIRSKLSLGEFSQSIYINDDILIANAKVKIVALDGSDKLCHISRLINF